MFYQVRANLLFTSEDEAKDFYHDCELALPKAGAINPLQENAEFSLIELIANNHDEAPTKLCTLIKSADNAPEQ